MVSSVDRQALRLCMKHALKAEKLLRWVLDEVDLSGHMELVAAIRAYLEAI